MKGQKNKYTCDVCGASIVTIDKNEGVTPMFIQCSGIWGCPGKMVSSMYMNVSGEPTFEWRNPTPEEYRKLSHAMKMHIDRGGLEIYPITKMQDEVPNSYIERSPYENNLVDPEENEEVENEERGNNNDESGN